MYQQRPQFEDFIKLFRCFAAGALWGAMKREPGENNAPLSAYLYRRLPFPSFWKIRRSISRFYCSRFFFFSQSRCSAASTDFLVMNEETIKSRRPAATRQGRADIVSLQWLAQIEDDGGAHLYKHKYSVQAEKESGHLDSGRFSAPKKKKKKKIVVPSFFPVQDNTVKGPLWPLIKTSEDLRARHDPSLNS